MLSRGGGTGSELSIRALPLFSVAPVMVQWDRRPPAAPFGRGASSDRTRDHYPGPVPLRLVTNHCSPEASKQPLLRVLIKHLS